MKSITRPPRSSPAVPPATRSSDVCTTLVGQKHVGAAIEAVCLTLQPPCAGGQRHQIGIVGNDHKHVDRIGLDRHDRAQNGNTMDTGNLSGGRNESARNASRSC
jgi:hypothetical protein